MVLSAVASRTRRIRLGSAVSLLPNNDPLRMAEDFATLDLLSHGRAELGVGSGVTEHNFRLFGQDVELSAAMAQENLNLILKLWNELDIEWSGRFRAPITDTCIQPRTLSGRALPITRATGGTEAVARATGAAGHKLALLTVIGDYASSRAIADVYRNAYRQAGHDPAGMSVSVAAYVYVADRPDAQERGRRFIEGYLQFTNEMSTRKTFNRNIAKRVVELGERALSKEPQMCGRPDQVIEMIARAHHDMGGFDEMKLMFDSGGISFEEVAGSMRLFAEAVAPNVRV
jgi:alkanesulfonate monooxygenase SsuD/methylene tetrahydromethanopterin reductase-like flavin-dependent oxidoreductase (luciferase family)